MSSQKSILASGLRRDLFADIGQSQNSPIGGQSGAKTPENARGMASFKFDKFPTAEAK
jgi:hypothetical protein